MERLRHRCRKNRQAGRRYFGGKKKTETQEKEPTLEECMQELDAILKALDGEEIFAGGFFCDVPEGHDT